MLQLARLEDREAVNALALQVHTMHTAWRPDLFSITDVLYPEARFEHAVKERQLYVAKIGGITVGYTLLLIRNYDIPGYVKRRVMLIDELCVHESCRN